MPDKKKAFTALSLFIYLLAAIAILGTFIPLLPFEEWFVRIFDYPKLQLLIIALLSLILITIFLKPKPAWKKTFIILLLAAISYQAYLIFPYTLLAPHEALFLPENSKDESQQLSLLVSNVYMKNEQYGQLLREIDQQQPDVVITLETDEKWKSALGVLKEKYPHFVEVPLDNTYGMLLHSRLPLINPEVRYLIEEDIPSIRTRIQLPSGQEIQLYAVHPRPPVPGENDDSEERDAEIVLIGKEAKADTLPVIVTGDFNDVAWSPTTQLFQEVSSLLDPRIGRGLYNTFNAEYPLLRWPLDHFFHSEHFMVIKVSRLANISSDHFPIYLRLQLDPGAAQQQEGKEPDEETHKEAEETIEKGNRKSDKME